MSTKIKFDAHSIKFRLWVYFAAIGMGVVGLIWFLQLFFMNNYYEEMVSSGIFNQRQMELFYTLIEIGMFYPNCQIFKQRDIAKSALYLVLSRSFRQEECAVFRKLLGLDEPELRACSRTLIHMWQYTANHNLYLSMKH